jgi:hypothetical protein
MSRRTVTVSPESMAKYVAISNNINHHRESVLNWLYGFCCQKDKKASADALRFMNDAAGRMRELFIHQEALIDEWAKEFGFQRRDLFCIHTPMGVLDLLTPGMVPCRTCGREMVDMETAFCATCMGKRA